MELGADVLRVVGWTSVAGSLELTIPISDGFVTKLLKSHLLISC